MTIPFKKSPIEFKQHLLFPSNIFDLLPDEHESPFQRSGMFRIW